MVFRQARKAGKPAILDAEASSNPAAMLAVQTASHALFSASGLASYSGTNSPEEGLRWASEKNRGWVGVTLGSQGVAWLEDGRLERSPAIRVRAVETLGAGDVFHGAFALALAEGQSDREAIGFASAVAALKCSRGGGRKSYPNRGEVFHFRKQYSHLDSSRR
jgi:sulfofructose kinase